MFPHDMNTFLFFFLFSTMLYPDPLIEVLYKMS